MNSNNEISNSKCDYCKNCENLGVEIRSETNSLAVECESLSNETKCRSWLEKCSIATSDGESVYSSEETSVSGAISETNYTEDTQEDEEEESDSFENVDDGISYEDRVICVQGEGGDMENLKLMKPNQYGNLKFRKCKKIVVGNVTKIYGSVHLTQNTSVVQSHTVKNQIFLEGSVVPVRPEKLHIIDRRSWLAQPPVEKREYLEKPAKYVIISHTASEDDPTQAQNIYLVRLIQTFHIESRKWSDIAYNFLIGCDGNVYEGRGWGIVGAHTYGYNKIGMGISFVGCFMNKLPPKCALDQAKLLIQHGVEIGAIDENYSLVGHCQCSAFESPGRRLFEEIKTWDHWDSMADKQHNSPDSPSQPI